MNERRLKVISDGTGLGTRVIDEATGEIIKGVLSLSWEHVAHDYSVLTLRIENVPIELTMEGAIQEIRTEVIYLDEHGRRERRWNERTST